jgi:hypothetical protein
MRKKEYVKVYMKNRDLYVSVYEEVMYFEDLHSDYDSPD